jgi:hypothetical protein
LVYDAVCEILVPLPSDNLGTHLFTLLQGSCGLGLLGLVFLS